MANLNLILQANDWPHETLGGYSDKNAYSPVLFQSSSSFGVAYAFLIAIKILTVSQIH